MINITKFRHIAIIVNDYEKMVEFYSKFLGFKIVKEFVMSNEDFGKGVGLPGAKAKVAHLSIPGNNVDLEIAEYNNKVARFKELSAADFPGYRHMAFMVENLESAYNILKESGIEFFSEPIIVKEPETVAGFRFVYFKDPEGNIVELSQLPL